MKEYKDYFKDKKITVMGLGLLGRGIGDIKFLAQQGAVLTVTDLKTKEQLVSSLKELEKFTNITYVLGEHRLEDFQDKDMVIKAAGVPLDSIYIAHARKNGVPVKMSTSLFAELTEATLVGITGTRGKSTVTHLIYEIFVNAHRNKKGNKKQKVFLGGNVKGVSTLALLPKVKKGDIIVLELDSWQLQGFGEAKVSPHIAVFTTLMTDHMNYYKNDMQAYFGDKANIYLNQKPEDAVIVGKQVSTKVKKTVGKKIVVDASLLPKSWKVFIPGEHNRYNISLAIATAREAGIPDSVIKKTVESYKGVEGRLQLIKTLKNGVKVYNDTTATTPEALITALKALGDTKDKKIVLIMGGADKKISMDAIFPFLKKYTKQLVVLPGTGTDILKNDQRFMNFSPAFVSNMNEAVRAAAVFCEEGDVLLLSPGFASFGIFVNEFDRGEQFNTVVKKLK